MLNLNLNLNLNDRQLLREDESNHPIQEPEGIAIIGMDAKAGSAVTKDALWQAFRDGLDMITELPNNRVSDAVNFAASAYGKTVDNFSERAYLPEIDSFEPEIFKISQREAELMDPVQRLYLQSAWSALEDAGYGGKRLFGSKTGVYVGFNQVGDSYESLLKDVPAEVLGLTVSGNISSFIASRISYLLNLTGPAMAIDTACSSSLVALHQACKALKDGEIDTAIVGSIRIFFCPERTGEDIGTTSSSERTKSFDASADGTGGGEGVINLVLKPLRSAVRDRDHIYAVIKGSAANQDGSSIGITAPNSAAQEQCIMDAWQAAGIHPEELTYIEAHGTATRLGDPVEIGGLTGAFSHFTQKKQFCALGAAKSNFGHLDCCSGLLGVVKVLLMMEHRMIPPSIHFTSPNPKIDYIHSPIYINDTLKPWEGKAGILTAGVSSFGLSGTNCHVIIQSYEMPSYPMTLALTHQVLTVSAATKGSLRKYLLGLQRYLKGRSDISLEDLCYSLNVGREQYSCRFAMVLRDITEFLRLSEEELLSPTYYASHRLTSMDTEEVGLLSVSQRRKLTEASAFAIEEQDWNKIAQLFLLGAEVDFVPMYESACVKMLSLPTYAFVARRCWYESKVAPTVSSVKTKPIHPLLDRCITESFGVRIYEKRMSPASCMELREHRIHGVCVLPGTVYVEMLYEIGRRHYGEQHFGFQSVTFFTLLTCDLGEERVIHCIDREDGGKLQVQIASKGADEQWIQHCEAILSQEPVSSHEKIDVDLILGAYSQVLTENDSTQEQFVELGEHWQTGQRIYVAQDSVVLYSSVPKQNIAEAQEYTLYPPLLDGSMNSGIYMLDGHYLPLNYKNMQFYAPLTGEVYSRITRLKHKEQGDQIALFHVELIAPDGFLIGEIQEYSLKRVQNSDSFLLSDRKEENMFQITWDKDESHESYLESHVPSCAVILHGESQSQIPFMKELESRFSRTVHMVLSEKDYHQDGDWFFISNSQDEMRMVLDTLGDLKNYLFIDILGFSSDPPDIEIGMNEKLRSAFHWVKCLASFAGKKMLRFLTMNSTSVTGNEDFYAPLNQTLIGFCSCIESELSDMEVSVIDADSASSVSVMADALCYPSPRLVTAIRENRYYAERLTSYTGDSHPIAIDDSDVILITGGYGGIGIAISEKIFEIAPHAKVLLLSRNIDKQSSYADRIKAMENQGFHIRLLRGDVTSEQDMSMVLNNIYEEYQHLDGIIHGAGLPGDGMLIHKSWEDAYAVMSPKIQGAYMLDALTEHKDLRYMILFSSFTSAVGAPGQTDYTMANAYLDSFTYRRNRKGKLTLTINWTGWKESGMAVDHGVQWQESFVHFVTDEEGRAYFAQALELGAPRVLACSFPEGIPEELNRRFVFHSNDNKHITSDEVVNSGDEMPIIYGKSPDKLTTVEKNIALAWARTLHVSEVNLYDKFFEAGGNSLLASYLQKEINRIYPDVMAITDVFLYSTISDIATYVSGKIEPPKKEEVSVITETGNIEALVQQFMDGQLSLEDIENLV